MTDPVSQTIQPNRKKKTQGGWLLMNGTHSGPLTCAHVRERSHIPLSTENAYIPAYAHLLSSLHTHTLTPSSNIENLCNSYNSFKLLGGPWRFISYPSKYLQFPGVHTTVGGKWNSPFINQARSSLTQSPVGWGMPLQPHSYSKCSLPLHICILCTQPTLTTAHPCHSP
jgi:hypothetical protein